MVTTAPASLTVPAGVPRVAVVGDNTIDRYVGTAERVFVGGNALNVAVNLVAAGIEAHYYGAIGPDADGHLIRRGLVESGVRTTGLVTLAGRTALTVIRLTADGDRVFESEEFGVTADYFPGTAELEDIARADWVHIGMLPRADDLRDELAARGTRAVVSQDCAVAAGFSRLDVAFGSVGKSEQAARDWAVSALRGGSGSVVVTRGPAGALATDGSVWWYQVAQPADVVDTTGAGDSFIAGFIESRLRSRSIARALAVGSRRAAATCGHPGGWPQDRLR
ncbi:MAG: putative carbohydrate kinase [Cryobacterium sp.]|jgi:fructoselysine 6-kinase|nr:putative carbohydrate kinase [Cryobacterium sp.]